MNLSTVIRPEDVILKLAATTKSDLIEKLSAHAASRLGLGEATIRAALMAREDLGSTGIGGRVAIPHAMIEGVETPFGILAVLKRAIEFDAVDAEPVDIIFLLLAPPGSSGEHLKILSAIARRARNEEVLDLLRSASSVPLAYEQFLVDEASVSRVTDDSHFC